MLVPPLVGRRNLQEISGKAHRYLGSASNSCGGNSRDIERQRDRKEPPLPYFRTTRTLYGVSIAISESLRTAIEEAYLNVTANNYYISLFWVILTIIYKQTIPVKTG